VHTSFDPFALTTARAVALRLDAPPDGAALLRRYPSEHPVTLLGRAARETTLAAALERPGEARWLVLAPLEAFADLANPWTVGRIAARLRAPDGCPWDREQTHASLRQGLLEEAYEALDALDAGDHARFADELGDVLFQVAIHAQLGAEAGTFDLGQVSRAIGDKLIRRHPHVFGGGQIADDPLKQWERIKRAESDAPRSLVDGIPRSTPALFAAERLQERSARLGLAPDRVEIPLDFDDPEFLGELLFDIVGESRELGFDAESALRAANARYADRVRALEERARGENRALESYTPVELRRMWEDQRR